MSGFRVRYQTIEFGPVDIHVRTLRDTQEFADPQGEAERLGISSATWPLFGVLWDAGKALANHMADYDVGERRILEVGCGIGLASLVLNHRDSDITATDLHPEAEGFLEANAALNGDDTIPFERTAWGDQDDELGLFDLIIASDVLYEQPHAELVANFIQDHAQPRCEVVVIDPRRGHGGRFGRAMESNGFDLSTADVPMDPEASKPFRASILTFRR